MKKGIRAVWSVIAASALLLASTLGVSADGQHGPLTGHLIGTGEWGKIEFVSKFVVPDAEPGLIADLTVSPNGLYAYLARWGGADCAGPEGNGPDGGVYIIDISVIEHPRQVGFIATHQDTLVGEGMQVVHLTTSAFTGDVLAINHEGCGKNYKAGFSLWDVTNPLQPRKLTENFGDFTNTGTKNRPHDANQYHSVFVWQAGNRAYLVGTDDDEAEDVDIYDITDPKKPVLIAEYDLKPRLIDQPELGINDTFLHDMVVKQINGRYIMLLSYWDGGFVLMDVTNPASAVLLGDSDYAAIDPEVLAATGVALTPEGNGHQAEFTIDNRFVIGTDEDFSPYRLRVTFNADGSPPSFWGLPGTNTTYAQAEAISGTTVFVGRACPGDPAVPPAPIVGTKQIAVVERGVCLFTEKVAAVLAAGGYEAVVIMNREGTDACTNRLVPSVEGAIPTIFIGRDAGFAMFDKPFDLAACLDATAQQAPIPIGTIGDPITSVQRVFDGWGYVHLFDVQLSSGAATLSDVDTFAIPEAMDPAFAEGFGDLSVHEVAVDPRNASLAYLSYYAGGLRAIQIQCSNPADKSTCDLVEVGGYLDPKGNNFWGVETLVRDGVTYILASDRDSGLWIFRDP